MLCWQLRHVMDDSHYREFYSESIIDDPARAFVDHNIVERWRNFLTKHQFISEFDSITMLSEFGIITQG